MDDLFGGKSPTKPSKKKPPATKPVAFSSPEHISQPYLLRPRPYTVIRLKGSKLTTFILHTD